MIKFLEEAGKKSRGLFVSKFGLSFSFKLRLLILELLENVCFSLGSDMKRGPFGTWPTDDFVELNFACFGGIFGPEFEVAAILILIRFAVHQRRMPLMIKVGAEEVFVFAGLLRRDTTDGVVNESLFEKVKTRFVQTLDLSGEVFAVPLWESCFVVRKGRNSGPSRIIRGSKDAKDFEDLVDFGVAREERTTGDHLGEDAADGPSVNSGGVLLATQQNFRGPVPQSNNFVSIGAKRNAESASQAKVGKLEVQVAIDQEILRFKIPMKDTTAVAEFDTGAELRHEFLDEAGFERDTLRDGLHVLLQVHVKELEDEIKLMTIGMNNVMQTHDVFIRVEFFEQGDLADGSGRDALVFLFETDLLEGDEAASVAKVTGFVDDTIGSFTYFVNSFVVLHGGPGGGNRGRSLMMLVIIVE